LDTFDGYHSEWNLGSPGGWDYQRTTQEIGEAVWNIVAETKDPGVELDFSHPYTRPVITFAGMLVRAHKKREGSNPGVIAVVAEEETLEDVTENRNLADRLSGFDGIKGVLIAPHWLELKDGKVAYQGEPVSVLFTDFNTDVLLREHRKCDCAPLVQAVREGRVINPRGTEPINVKSMFEVLTSPGNERFHPETVRRTPWTRQFYERKTAGPNGEDIDDLFEWTRKNWDNLVLKPERGYSGKGVRVGVVNESAEEAINLALSEGDYIVQQKIPLNLWAEDVPEVDHEAKSVFMRRYQTDHRCFNGPDGLIGFLARIGDVPTNVGSGGGMQPIAVLRSDMTVKDAVERANNAIASLEYGVLARMEEVRKRMAMDAKFTYLLGPIKIALRPRIVTPGHLEALAAYGKAMWEDCLKMEKMWLEGELDHIVKIEEEELDIARSQPWKGSDAIIASDGLFSFGAHPRE